MLAHLGWAPIPVLYRVLVLALVAPIRGNRMSMNHTWAQIPAIAIVKRRRPSRMAACSRGNGLRKLANLPLFGTSLRRPELGQRIMSLIHGDTLCNEAEATCPELLYRVNLYGILVHNGNRSAKDRYSTTHVRFLTALRRPKIDNDTP